MLVIYRWTGFTVGLVLIFLALTGLTLVFRPQLMPVLAHQLAMLSSARPLSLDDLIACAETYHGAAKIAPIEIGRESTAGTMVRLANKQSIYLNRASARWTAGHLLAAALSRLWNSTVAHVLAKREQ